MEREVYRIEKVFDDTDYTFNFKFLVYGEALIYASSITSLYDKILSFYDAFYDNETYKSAINCFICDFDEVASEFSAFHKKATEIRNAKRKEHFEELKATAKELLF